MSTSRILYCCRWTARIVGVLGIGVVCGMALGANTVRAQSPSGNRDDATASSRGNEELVPEAERLNGRDERPLLTRDEAIETAVEQNHGIRIQTVETDIAERNVSIGNAEYLPSVDAVAGQDHLFGGPGFFGNQRVYTQTRLGVQLNWLAFAGWRRPALYERFETLSSIESIRREAEIEQTLLEVTTAYADVLRQKRLVDALKRTETVSEERVEIAQTRIDAGTGAEVDLNLARVELNRDRSAVADQQIALVEAKTRLNRALGRDADQPFRVEGEIAMPEAIDYEKARERALSDNRQLQVARRQVDVSQTEVAEAKSQRWPTVNVGLGYNYTGFHSGLVPDFETPPGLEYGINLRVPIFDGFNIGRRIDNARSRKTISSRQVRQEETRIRADLRGAYEAYTQHLERVSLARESVGLAEENTEIGLTELRAGRITQVDLRQIQLNLLDARTRLINAKYDAKRAELRIRQLAGRLYGELLE